ncbi:uncharacterized protein KQ657_001723 [Scheffersomyces spartinae]|uniref:DNA damage-binding protein CMR1 n=1 Tax=Scheffersomyces spartinae TaxID=45513 RepID=A0A9P7V834_9ASCO|nr:uncharacterized protein KQ657_001723 [Scheffersomyces spartinae]KAG7192621.1 hypothetical protein KQ657_001723 [Scheffersomyces spartinae]
MGLSEFQKARVENIERNRALLRQLELEGLSESISNDVGGSDGKDHVSKKPKNSRTRSKVTPVKREPSEPTRRSRRIMGIKVENSEEFSKLREEEERVAQRKRQLETLRLTRLIGDFLLSDLLTDKKLGSLKHEDRVIKLPDELKSEENDVIKGEDIGGSIATSEETEVLAILQLLGDKFSAGDFYETIRNLKTTEYASDKDLQKKRLEFDKLHVYEKYDPLAIKITHARITSMAFHPSTTDRLVFAGDTVGHLGMWSIDNQSSATDEPTISILKPHGKAISKIVVHDKTKVLSSSYDGSVRQLDLNKLTSSELTHLIDPFYDNETIGVSDINLCDDGNSLYMTSLSGSFYKQDLREPLKTPTKKNLLRLHDKKIGSFSINPNASHQIATASLDRTLRVWDLRQCSGKNSWWSDYEHQISPHCYGTYGSSLSVSCVDWNSQNHLVCNGYDNYILLFDFNGTESEYPLVTTWANDFQPNTDNKKEKTSKKTEDHQLPENLKPFTKIRHNCQTGRWVSILKSKWQTNPKDDVQKFVIANMNRGLDIYDQKGQILGHLTDNELVGAVPAVATFHPTENWVIGGSASGKVYFFEQ